MTKTTQKMAVLYAIENLVDAPADVIEKLESIVVSLDKKAGAARKPTAIQVQNEVYKQNIMDYMMANRQPLTVSGAIAAIPELNKFSTPKVSALMNGLVETGHLIKSKDGRATVFAVAA